MERKKIGRKRNVRLANPDEREINVMLDQLRKDSNVIYKQGQYRNERICLPLYAKIILTLSHRTKPTLVCRETHFQAS